MDAIAAASSSLIFVAAIASLLALLAIAEDDGDLLLLFLVASSSPMVNPTCRTIGCGLDEDGIVSLSLSLSLFRPRYPNFNETRVV